MCRCGVENCVNPWLAFILRSRIDDDVWCMQDLEFDVRYMAGRWLGLHAGFEFGEEVGRKID